MDLEILDMKKNKISQFNKKGIYTIEDLVSFLPRKYYDFTEAKLVKDLKDNEFQAVIGVVDKVSKKNSMINVTLKDEGNRNLYITFFNNNYLFKTIKNGDKYLACGKIQIKGDFGFKTMTNPIIFTKEIEKNLRIYPIYSSIKGVSDNYLKENINAGLTLMDKEDYIENVLLSKYNLIPKYKSLRLMHQPKTKNDLKLSYKRKLFDELFMFNFKLKQNNQYIDTCTNVEIKTLKKSKELMDSLPFDLTEGQRLALRNLVLKMKSGKRINALVQGDVGVGKTLVAILLMLAVSENGYQSCIVAPTNILAKQHYQEIKERVEPLGLKVGFLSAELKKREQNMVLKQIKEGELDMIVGTHSLMSEKVEFNNLGIAIIDEEHRFGVNQRDMLNKEGVHKVSMSATPIPRSLALSMYGDDIDVQTIKSSPKGRQDIITDIISSDDNTIYENILEQLKLGHQAYIVCPLITKSESDKLEGVANIEEEYEFTSSFFAKYGFKVGFVTGNLKDNEINDVLDGFRNKEYDVLVATTIIEVGVNVPNATVIAIKNAERFGFAQLHQLRGRVGRGNFKSYCYLMTNSNSTDKFSIFKETRDGFKIAEQDLLLRGSGSFLGTQQSGENKFLMLMLSKPKLNSFIKTDINDIFSDSSRLNKYKNLLNCDIV